jgi:hypothetical protein
MLMLSIGAHILIVGILWLTPTAWRSRTAPEAAVMELSLGGLEGPEYRRHDLDGREERSKRSPSRMRPRSMPHRLEGSGDDRVHGGGEASADTGQADDENGSVEGQDAHHRSGNQDRRGPV